MDLGSDQLDQKLTMPEIGESWVEHEDPFEASKRLRISLTNRCNLACFFCHNEGQGAPSRKRELLSVEDLSRIAQAARQAGIKSVKLTGGEPTIFRAPDGRLVDVIRAIRDAYHGFDLDLSMTTNGVTLSQQANALKAAGLDRLTVSLSSLQRETHRDLLGGRRSSPEQVVAGIEAAQLTGLTPLKVNMVLFDAAPSAPGNLQEIPDVIKLCRKLSVAELRLYPMLVTDSNPAASERHAYWDTSVKSILASALKGRDGRVPDAVLGVLDDVVSGRFDAIAKSSRFTLKIYIGDLFLALNMMKPDRRRRLPGLVDEHHCQEGVYALRLASNGDLRVCLEQEPITTLSAQLSAGASIDSLAATMAVAQEAFIAHHSS